MYLHFTLLNIIRKNEKKNHTVASMAQLCLLAIRYENIFFYQRNP